MSLYPDFTRAYPNSSVENKSENVSTRWILFRGREIVVQTRTNDAGDEIVSLPDDAARIAAHFPGPDALALGRRDRISYQTGEIGEETELPNGWRTLDLRTLYGRVADDEWAIAGYANHILYWRQTSGFCPVCGTAMGAMGAEWQRHCPNCGHIRYPSVSPAVLILVHDGADRILLAHKPGWGDRYSILAGFVLPGESLEECAQREVEEEVGVTVTDLNYAGSQPWPFPQQLMIGLTARYVAGDIRLDEEELDRAAWFDATALPGLPSPLSLSRQMINAWQRSRLANPPA